MRYHLRSALVLVAVLAIAVLVVVPPLVLPPSLRFEPLVHDDWGIAWSALARTPDAARTAALAGMVRVLRTAALGVLAIGLLSLLSLSIARATQRRAEMVVRRSVGASRRMLRRAAIGEGLLLAIAGCGAGAIGVAVIAPLIAGAWPALRGPVVAGQAPLAVALLVGCVVLGALLPLLFARQRSPGADARAAAIPLLVPAVQFGLGLLGIIAGTQLAQRRPGTAPAAAQGTPGTVLLLTVSDSSRVTRATKYATLLSRLQRDSMLASLTSPGTTIGLGTVDYITTECGRCFQGGLPMPLHVVRATSHLASADTFQAMGMQLVAGRGLTDADRWGSAPVAVVNRWLAERDFEGGQAVGRRVRVGGAEDLYTVVGIVEDGRAAGFGAGEQPRYRVYLPSLQQPAGQLELLVRSASMSPEALASAAAAILGEASVGAPRSEREMLDREAAAAGWFAAALRYAGWGGIVIALFGMLAVMRLWVQAELPEIALRRAVGARRHHVLGRVAARAVAVVAGGMAIAWWISGSLALVPVPLALLFAATLIAALGPAWKAALSAPATLPGFSDL